MFQSFVRSSSVQHSMLRRMLLLLVIWILLLYRYSDSSNVSSLQLLLLQCHKSIAITSSMIDLLTMFLKLSRKQSIFHLYVIIDVDRHTHIILFYSWHP